MGKVSVRWLVREIDVNMRQITQSKNQFNHETYLELSVGMEYDLDINVLNKDIDGLLDNESPEISDDEEAAFDITNLDLEIVNTVDYVDSGVDELVNSPVKDASLKMLNNDDSESIKDLKNGETVLSEAELVSTNIDGEKVLTTFDTCSNVTLILEDLITEKRILQLEVKKPNSKQGLESKVSLNRMCNHEEVSKVENTGAHEHEKITPSSISKSDDEIDNMTSKGKDDSHTRVTEGVSKALRMDFNDAFGFDTLTEEDNLDKWVLVAESNLPEKEGISIVEKFEDVFNFEIMSEKDNLNNWLLNAEFNSFKDKTKKNLTKISDKSSNFSTIDI